MVATSAMLCGCAARKADLGATSLGGPGPRPGVSAPEITHLLKSDPVRAEAALRTVIEAEPFNGPAHNNLGVALLHQGELYEAANECETARKLMPGHPDPRVNLALVLECAGRVDDAISTFGAALEVSPNYIPALQGLTRLQISSGRTDQGTASMLDDISLRGETQEWRDWARLQSAKLTK
jgi:Flp pilus assembly protein TadD